MFASNVSAPEADTGSSKMAKGVSGPVQAVKSKNPESRINLFKSCLLALLDIKKP
jgi:hypothetical protein